jgi:hypothetical protein
MKLKRYVAVSESGVLFNASTGDSFSVNPVAVKIIEMIKQELNEDGILQRMYELYEVDRDRLSQDYFDFIGHLKQLNLLENDGEGTH